jgi:hypothetical protein
MALNLVQWPDDVPNFNAIALLSLGQKSLGLSFWQKLLNPKFVNWHCGLPFL